MDNLTKLKYTQFLTSDGFSLFEFVIKTEINDTIELMLNESDKDKMFIHKQHIDALKNLQTNIKSKALSETD